MQNPAFMVPQPPYDMQMSDAIGWFTVFIFIPLGVAIAIAFAHLAQGKGPMLLLCLVGGVLAAAFEPIVDVLGLVYFPDPGVHTAFTFMGRPLPWLIVFVYSWYVGGQAYVAYRVIERGIDRAGVFRLWAIFAAINVVLETPGLLGGVYTYYGAQPLDFWGFPLWWSIVNPLMPVVGGALISKVGPELGSGWKLVGVIPLIPMADGIANAATGWPLWIALNSGIGYTVTYPALIVTLGLVMYSLWVVSLAVARPIEQAVGSATAHDSHANARSATALAI